MTGEFEQSGLTVEVNGKPNSMFPSSYDVILDMILEKYEDTFGSEPNRWDAQDIANVAQQFVANGMAVFSVTRVARGSVNQGFRVIQ